jgi:hypothetical protein
MDWNVVERIYLSQEGDIWPVRKIQRISRLSKALSASQGGLYFMDSVGVVFSDGPCSFQQRAVL